MPPALANLLDRLRTAPGPATVHLADGALELAPVAVPAALAEARQALLQGDSGNRLAAAYETWLRELASRLAEGDPTARGEAIQAQLLDSVRLQLGLPGGNTCEVILRSPLHPRQVAARLDGTRGSPIVALGGVPVLLWDGDTPDGWAVYVPPGTASWAPAARAARLLGFTDPSLARLLPALSAAAEAYRNLDSLAINVLLPAGAGAGHAALASCFEDGPARPVSLRFFVAADYRRETIESLPTGNAAVASWHDYLTSPPPAHVTILAGLAATRVRHFQGTPPGAAISLPEQRGGWSHWPAASILHPAWWQAEDTPGNTLIASLAAGKPVAARAGLFTVLPDAAQALLLLALRHSDRVLLADPLLDVESLQRRLARGDRPVLLTPSPAALMQPSLACYAPLRSWLGEAGLEAAFEPVTQSLAAHAPWVLAATPFVPSAAGRLGLALLLLRRLGLLDELVVLPEPAAPATLHLAGYGAGQPVRFAIGDATAEPGLEGFVRAVHLAVAAGTLEPDAANRLASAPPPPAAWLRRRVELNARPGAPLATLAVEAGVLTVTLGREGVLALLTEEPLPAALAGLAERWLPPAPAMLYRRPRLAAWLQAADRHLPYGPPPPPPG